jgi:hypothetical protein
MARPVSQREATDREPHPPGSANGVNSPLGDTFKEMTSAVIAASVCRRDITGAGVLMRGWLNRAPAGSTGALQVDGGPGDARSADRAQTGAERASALSLDAGLSHDQTPSVWAHCTFSRPTPRRRHRSGIRRLVRLLTM